MKHSVNNAVGFQLLTVEDLEAAAIEENVAWEEYVKKTGYTSGNRRLGWWDDVQHRALRKKGWTRKKFVCKGGRLRKLVNMNEGYFLIKFALDVSRKADHHYASTDCNVSPSLLFESSNSGPVQLTISSLHALLGESANKLQTIYRITQK